MPFGLAKPQFTLAQDNLHTSADSPQHDVRHEQREQAINLADTKSSGLTNRGFGGEHAGSSFELVTKVGSGPIEGVAPGRATALAP